MKTLVLRVEPNQGDGDCFEVKVSGVVAYHVEADCLQNIVVDIVEVSADVVVGDGKMFAEFHRQHGWLPGWDPLKEGPAQFLLRQGCSPAASG